MDTLQYEDIPIGTKFTDGEYELSKEEIVQFASRWDPQVFHVDEDSAQGTLYRGLTASASHTFCIFSLLYSRMPQKIKAMGLLGMEQIRLPNPVRPGDRLSLMAECIDRRESRSRPGVGIITTRSKLVNQQGKTVMEVTGSWMVERRGA